ncbi:MAG TPA: hypothetical protein VGQ76_14215 [Thermoanaerobaculia bacterium]|jgi:hypothetical protein|nr:hypothetical protein [Thermoanaerobaculia bacterium]
MSDVATFFRQREKDPGETYQFQIKGPKGTYRVSVYSRKPMQSSTLRSRSVPDKKSLDCALEDLLNDLVNQGGGGCVVTALDYENTRQFTVRSSKGASFDPVSRFYVLSPGRPPGQRVTEKNHNESPGSHAIVPVGENASECFENFLGYLSWFAPDLESLVLNSIRRPSLDARLDKVEKQLWGQTSEQELRGSWLLSMKRVAKSTSFRIAGIVLGVLLVAAGALWFLGDPGKWRLSLMPATTASSATIPSTDSSETVNQEESRDEFASEASELILRLRDRREASNTVKLMWDAHFKDIDVRQNPTDEQIATLFGMYKGPDDHRAGDTNFIWGLIKIQALEINSDPSLRSESFLKAFDAYSATKAALLAGGIERDKDARHFVAALACRLGDEDPPLPRLTGKNARSGPLGFGGECQDYTTAHLIQGLKDLTSTVEGLP